MIILKNARLRATTAGLAALPMLCAATPANADTPTWSTLCRAAHSSFDKGIGIGLGIVFGVALVSIISGAIDALKSRNT